MLRGVPQSGTRRTGDLHLVQRSAVVDRARLLAFCSLPHGMLVQERADGTI